LFFGKKISLKTIEIFFNTAALFPSWQHSNWFLWYHDIPSGKRKIPANSHLYQFSTRPTQLPNTKLNYLVTSY